MQAAYREDKATFENTVTAATKSSPHSFKESQQEVLNNQLSHAEIQMQVQHQSPQYYQHWKHHYQFLRNHKQFDNETYQTGKMMHEQQLATANHQLKLLHAEKLLLESTINQLTYSLSSPLHPIPHRTFPHPRSPSKSAKKQTDKQVEYKFHGAKMSPKKSKQKSQQKSNKKSKPTTTL